MAEGPSTQIVTLTINQVLDISTSVKDEALHQNGLRQLTAMPEDLAQLMQIKPPRPSCVIKSLPSSIRRGEKLMRYYFDISDRLAIRDEVGRDFELTSDAVLHAKYPSQPGAGCPTSTIRSDNE